MTILIAILAFSLGFLISSVLSAATISDLEDRLQFRDREDFEDDDYTY